MNKKVYLKGDGTIETGIKIIKYLELLGASNPVGWDGDGDQKESNNAYFIDDCNEITINIPPLDYIFLDINNLPIKVNQEDTDKDNLKECFELIINRIDNINNG